jgi:hypothetical protein
VTLVSATIVVATGALLTAYFTYPSAKDVLVHGRVVDGTGAPLTGVKILVGDIERGFPKDYFGENAYVYTDADGRYELRLKRIHRAAWTEMVDWQKYMPCDGPSDWVPPDTYPSQFLNKHEVKKDFVYCVRPANQRLERP